MDDQTRLLIEIRDLIQAQGQRSQEMLELSRRWHEGERKSQAARDQSLEEQTAAYKSALRKGDIGGRILSGALALLLIAFGYMLATWR